MPPAFARAEKRETRLILRLQNGVVFGIVGDISGSDPGCHANAGARAVHKRSSRMPCGQKSHVTYAEMRACNVENVCYGTFHSPPLNDNHPPIS